ncbi:DUF2254 domain-containing protein [Ramlibacter rhizophilus]|uniref:DUF2254 domain-containing protein n=1 Tax=Ramlibacter rhizophilus TaxID=1781167 RepID=A0A4Z0BBL8_9BURK|nr:DUF2254 domain-containing protein [Ramlibacter rhizophilus]TFY96545.1 DUF2254 domain-containing protein [Ramlibacter rhizophilus]
MTRLRAFWNRLQASFWFVPALVVAASVLAAVGLVQVEDTTKFKLAQWSPRLFGASADGSRAMLSAVATSMITVAGVVFSITIVTLSLTSTQYSPRVLRNFMRDRTTQMVLGIFVGIFAYCLAVLRTIRGPDDGDFVPSLAALGGLLYALVGIAMLIYFIHHVAQSIQSTSIMARVSNATAEAIDTLFPQELGHSPEPVPVDRRIPTEWVEVKADCSGYLAQVDSEGLMKYARECGRTVRLCAQVGEFVASGAPLVAVSGHAALPEKEQKHLRGTARLEEMRTIEQDAAFGLTQLVDVAVRALSPGMNDLATACMCVDRLGALLAQLAARSIPSPLRYEGQDLRVIAPAPDFGDLLSLSFEPVIRQCRGQVMVLSRLVTALETVTAATSSPQRRAAMRPVLRELRAEIQLNAPRPRIAELKRRLRALETRLEAGA